MLKIFQNEVKFISCHVRLIKTSFVGLANNKNIHQKVDRGKSSKLNQQFLYITAELELLAITG